MKVRSELLRAQHFRSGSGVHKKSTKAARRSEKIALRKDRDLSRY